MNKQRFAYDEMVMATDGTRYYIKYLDDKPSSTPGTGSSNGQVHHQQQQQQQQQQIGRTTIYRNIQPNVVTVSKQTISTAGPMSSAPRVQNGNLMDVHGNYLCPICKKAFKHRHSLPFHMERFHKTGGGGVNELQDCSCPCGKKFLNRNFMRRHQLEHYKNTGRPCDKAVPVEELKKLSEKSDSVTVSSKPAPSATTDVHPTSNSFAQLMRAVYAVKKKDTDQIVAARTFNVPRQMLARYVYTHDDEMEKFAKENMTEETEKKLRDKVIKRYETGDIITSDDVLLMAQAITGKNGFTQRRSSSQYRTWTYYFLDKYLQDLIDVIGTGEEAKD